MVLKCGSPTFSRRRRPNQVTAPAMGNTSRKSIRHEPCCRTKPETVGPRAGATEIAMVTLPITRPRSLSGTTVIRVVISSGIITAVPTAWVMRPRRSTSKTGAAAASAVPARKTPIAVA